MNTSIALVVLASMVSVSTDVEAPAWMTDYAQARTQGQTQQKPLAVVFGSGAAGQDKVCREGKLTDQAKKLLADKFVCVYVDQSTPAGKALASSFEIANEHGLVVSNRAGNLMAFHHNGELTAADLSRSLERFSDPSLVVTTTVTDLNSRVSYYPPSAAGSAVPYYPSMFGGTTYCPTCQQR